MSGAAAGPLTQKSAAGGGGSGAAKHAAASGAADKSPVIVPRGKSTVTGVAIKSAASMPAVRQSSSNAAVKSVIVGTAVQPTVSGAAVKSRVVSGSAVKSVIARQAAIEKMAAATAAAAASTDAESTLITASVRAYARGKLGDVLCARFSDAQSAAASGKADGTTGYLTHLGTSEEDQRGVAADVEDGLFQAFRFKDVLPGKKQYMNKLRSLVFNIEKNEKLFHDIVCKNVSPSVLVKMSASEMAEHTLKDERRDQLKSDIDRIRAHEMQRDPHEPCWLKAGASSGSATWS